jgi:hypothetical protein
VLGDELLRDVLSHGLRASYVRRSPFPQAPQRVHNGQV